MQINTEISFRTLIVIMGIVFAINQPATMAADHDEVSRGEAAFVEMACHECHGYQGYGGGNGPRLSPSEMQFQAFAQIVRKPYGMMPAYPTSELADEKLGWIHEYLQSLPQPPDPNSIPALTSDY